MMICPECNGTGKTVYFVEVGRDENSVTCEKKECICRTCNGSGEKTMTNADRIRVMSDEQLMKFIQIPFCDRRENDQCRLDYCGNCQLCIMDWLQQSAEDE